MLAMRMIAKVVGLIILLACHHLSLGYSEIAGATAQRNNGQSSSYYWKSESVAGSAQLLTLFCRSCDPSHNGGRDVPLVSVLRDTLGDDDVENDRVTFIWLLTSTRPRLGQRILSAIPFFYWRVGRGSGSAKKHDTTPLMDLSAPQRPMMAQAERQLIQWTAFDPLGGPVRASTHAYRTNASDDERVWLDEAINYLRLAPVSNDATALTQTQVNTVIARLQLRNTLLGGLVDEAHAKRIGAQSEFDRERIRSRNWELLRQWADKTGLIFEPLNVAGTHGHYAILWFPQERSTGPGGISLHSIWTLMGIQDPWSDERVKQWSGPLYERVFDGSGPKRVIPLAVYSLDYPKLPLALVDFRCELNERSREVTQRSISELTSGVLGLSHFANWYFYAASDLYDFVSGRHGKAMDEASRLDCFSDFRMELALDEGIDPVLKVDMERRIRWLGVNPLGSAPEREMQDAFAHYELIRAEAENGRLSRRIEQERRFELSSFGESEKANAAKSMLHVATFGLYKQQAAREDVSAVDRDRRVTDQLTFLESLIQSNTLPEIAYDRRRIDSSVRELSNLMPAISSRSVRSRAEVTLGRLRSQSHDPEIQEDCTAALAWINHSNNPGSSSSTVGARSAHDGRGVVLAQNEEQMN
jgi:hypothetical protein